MPLRGSQAPSTPGFPPSSSSSNHPLLFKPNMNSPTSAPSSLGHSSATRAFFGAITERVRGRSRSRSPAPARSAQVSPPETAAKMQQPQQQPTHQSKPQSPYRTTSQSTSASSKADRTSIGSVDRTQWDQMVYGRHSSDWLFKSQRTLKRQSTGSSISSSRS